MSKAAPYRKRPAPLHPFLKMCFVIFDDEAKWKRTA